MSPFLKRHASPFQYFVIKQEENEKNRKDENFPTLSPLAQRLIDKELESEKEKRPNTASAQ